MEVDKQEVSTNPQSTDQNSSNINQTTILIQDLSDQIKSMEIKHKAELDALKILLTPIAPDEDRTTLLIKSIVDQTIAQLTSQQTNIRTSITKEMDERLAQWEHHLEHRLEKFTQAVHEKLTSHEQLLNTTSNAFAQEQESKYSKLATQQATTLASIGFQEGKVTPARKPKKEKPTIDTHQVPQEKFIYTTDTLDPPPTKTVSAKEGWKQSLKAFEAMFPPRTAPEPNHKSN
jgi:hypothetical protein